MSLHLLQHCRKAKTFSTNSISTMSLELELRSTKKASFILCPLEQIACAWDYGEVHLSMCFVGKFCVCNSRSCAKLLARDNPIIGWCNIWIRVMTRICNNTIFLARNFQLVMFFVKIDIGPKYICLIVVFLFVRKNLRLFCSMSIFILFCVYGLDFSKIRPSNLTVEGI